MFFSFFFIRLYVIDRFLFYFRMTSFIILQCTTERHLGHLTVRMLGSNFRSEHKPSIVNDRDLGKRLILR